METDDDSLFAFPGVPLPAAQSKQELSELIARYRVAMNQLVGRMMYLERTFRRSSDAAAEMVGGFVDSFIESCASVPEDPEEWDGAKCYTSSGCYGKVQKMYVAARDLRRIAKQIVTIRRHFYRDLKILAQRHLAGQSAFDAAANLRINERRQWTMEERKIVWEAGKRQCRYCGVALESCSGSVMHIDHIVPRIAGGGDDVENLCAACISCNLKKNAKSEESFLAALLAGAALPFIDGIESRTES